MLHVFVEGLVQGNQAVIADSLHLHHLTVVSRVRLGDAITLFDSQGNTYQGTIASITKNEISVNISQCVLPAPPAVYLTVACAIPKGSGIDDIIDQLTQMGADCIIPMITARVVWRPDDPDKKMERWRKIALSAAEQSQRSGLPEIPGVMDFSEVVSRTREDNLKLIPTLEGQNCSLHSALQDFRAGRLTVLIGPEGDFTLSEVEQALQAGFVGVSLGHNVLRVDTAALAVAAMIKLSLGDEV
jgi:16S rRNA (uracil1498-N3)-methyltransferase